jgi:hypothetical protein
VDSAQTGFFALVELGRQRLRLKAEGSDIRESHLKFFGTFAITFQQCKGLAFPQMLLEMEI